MFPPSVCELLKRSSVSTMWSETLATALSTHCATFIAELVRLTSLLPEEDSAKKYLHDLLVHVAGTCVLHMSSSRMNCRSRSRIEVRSLTRPKAGPTSAWARNSNRERRRVWRRCSNTRKAALRHGRLTQQRIQR